MPELLASLNHPNIAAIYGIESTTSSTAVGGGRALSEGTARRRTTGVRSTFASANVAYPLTIAVTHVDPVFYSKPYVATFSYLRLPGGKILPWDCTPEEANYERFIPKSK